MGLSREWGWWGRCAPVARYPTTSDGAVAILCPHRQALGGCLGEHPIALGDGAVAVGDTVAVRCHGTLLQGTATKAVGLGKIQQEGGTVTADHTGALQEQGGDTLGIAQEGGEAGGGDDGKHRSLGRGVVEVCPPRLNVSYSIGGRWQRSGVEIGTVPEVAQRDRVGGGRRLRLEVEPIAAAYGLAGGVATVGVISATPHLVRLSPES
jgi:hypothetical protein